MCLQARSEARPRLLLVSALAAPLSKLEELVYYGVASEQTYDRGKVRNRPMGDG